MSNRKRCAEHDRVSGDRGADDGVPTSMTSMIDVVFLLLIFFMCATQFKIPEGSLRAFLPRNGGPGQSPMVPKCRILLAVADSGEIRVRIDERTIPGQTGDVSWYELEHALPAPDERAILEHLIARRDNYDGLQAGGLPVVIDFGGNVPVEHVVQILNLCHEADIHSIGFAAPEIPLK